MANYYNVKGFRNTGFFPGPGGYYPESREVLENMGFSTFTVKGVSVKRDDALGLNYLDVSGSVKDSRGEQNNPPNTTGSIGPDGPYYDWENVDYIRLVRTGYPGDVDFIDISGHMKDPWAAVHDSDRVLYYFVTSMKPLSRNVTRLFLKLDELTTSGGVGYLEFTGGFKIRGHISEAEDSTTYNTAPEAVAPIEPLRITSSALLKSERESEKDLEFYVSSADLTQFNDGQVLIDGVTIEGRDERTQIIGQLKASNATNFPATVDQQFTNICFPGIGVYDSSNDRVKYNMTMLYSLGQLSLQEGYVVPGKYAAAVIDSLGFVSTLSGRNEFISNPISSPIIGGYPRKAGYLFAQECLCSTATGEMNFQQAYDISDRQIWTWAIAIPGGSPHARFKGLRNHFLQNDQSVSGASWRNKGLVLTGASGSFWNNLNASFSQQNITRAMQEQKQTNYINDARLINKGVNVAANTAIDTAQLGASGVSLTNWVSGGEETFDAARMVANDVRNVADLGIDVYAEYQNQKFANQRLTQSQAELNAAMIKNNLQAPSILLSPSMDTSIFSKNGFAVYGINITTNDYNRLKKYFLRYGYNGLVKDANWSNILVKSKVNYVQTENASFISNELPMRFTSRINEIFNNGVFLWSQKPSEAAFESNPDR